MEDNRISEIMDTTMTKIKQLVDTNTIVGNPITTPDGIMVIPVSRVSFGFGTGGTAGNASKCAGGSAGGVKVEPIGFMVIKDGTARMINISAPATTSVERVVEMIPDIIDKVEGIVDKYAAKKEK